jgi:hypothetical protein
MNVCAERGGIIPLILSLKTSSEWSLSPSRPLYCRTNSFLFSSNWRLGWPQSQCCHFEKDRYPLLLPESNHVPSSSNPFPRHYRRLHPGSPSFLVIHLIQTQWKRQRDRENMCVCVCVCVCARVRVRVRVYEFLYRHTTQNISSVVFPVELHRTDLSLSKTLFDLCLYAKNLH